MYCTQCGAANDDTATSCAQCQSALVQPASLRRTVPASVPNYLTQAILVTVCCCLIPGIVAIVYAAQVNGYLRVGDLAGAQRCSRLAHIWSWVGFGLGVTCALIYGIVAALGTFVSR